MDDARSRASPACSAHVVFQLYRAMDRRVRGKHPGARRFANSGPFGFGHLVQITQNIFGAFRHQNFLADLEEAIEALPVIGVTGVPQAAASNSLTLGE